MLKEDSLSMFDILAPNIEEFGGNDCIFWHNWVNRLIWYLLQLMFQLCNLRTPPCWKNPSQDLYDTAPQSRPPASPPPSTWSQTDDSDIVLLEQRQLCKPAVFGCNSKPAALGYNSKPAALEFNPLRPPKPASTSKRKATAADVYKLQVN